ncbi:ParB/RepB/Spo0J family partition protein [Nonomuraea sp. NPDC050536]|uniref:ParB/RepB/Spo0J family partition protein n=1 Tax=Nonomuraea sp. NPDC050536 TaxID=3364366 RepID=UPI0037CBE739
MTTATSPRTAAAAPAAAVHPELAKALALLATGHTLAETGQLLDWPAGAVRALVAHQKGWLINENGHVYDPGQPDHRVRLPAGVPAEVVRWARQTDLSEGDSPAPEQVAAKGRSGLRVACLPVDRIHTDPHNIRGELGDIAELSDSIREHGVLQPVTVQALSGQPGHYKLIMGERRYTGALEAGERELLAIISPTLSEAATLERMLVENCQRAELNPMDKAEAFGKLRDVHHYSPALIAQRTGLSASTISYFLCLLDLDAKTRERVRSGNLPVKEAIALVRRFRASQRPSSGGRPRQASWEPDHFTSRHPLAKQAQQLCQGQEHGSRRQVGQMACGQCWEQAIRADERHAIAASAETATAPDTGPGHSAGQAA